MGRRTVCDAFRMGNMLQSGHTMIETVVVKVYSEKPRCTRVSRVLDAVT